MADNTSVSQTEAKAKAEKLKEIARDYDKQAWALLLIAPLAMLTYSMDKLGVIGFSSGWEWATWGAWLILTLGIAVGGRRMFVISKTWHLRSDEAEAESLPVGDAKRTQAKAAADVSESCNKSLRDWQVRIIGLGFAALLIAHVVRAIESQPARDEARIERLERALKLYRLDIEARERGLKVP